MTLLTTDTPLFVSILIFTSALLLYAGVFLFIREHAKRKKLVRKISQEEADMKNLSTHSLENASNGTTREKMIGVMASFGKRMKKEKAIRYSPTGIKFLQAGYRRRDVIHIFWGARFFFAILFSTLLLVLSFTGLHLMSSRHLLAGSILSALFGFYLPEIWLRFKIYNRQNQIAQGFADVLDLMCVCVEAGMGLDAAISRVAEEIKLNNKAWSR